MIEWCLKSIQLVFSKDVLLVVLGTLIGFGLTVLWDRYKDKKTEEVEKGVVLRFAREENERNKAIAKKNLDHINGELEDLKNNRSRVTALIRLKSDVLNVATIKLPMNQISTNFLAILSKTSSLIIECNEQIQSRENFRSGGGGLDIYAAKLKIYDEQLKVQLMELLDQLGRYEDWQLIK
jgi:hypothetical protein